jgi:hypothetical protein
MSETNGGLVMTNNTARIRDLNDALRKNLIGGSAVMTSGIAALGPTAVSRIVQSIAVFDDFCPDNDPYPFAPVR